MAISSHSEATLPIELSRLLLHLYQVARERSFDSFQDIAVREICRHIAFDGSWWGMATLVGGRYRIHGSHLWGLPGDVPQLVNRADSETVVEQRVTEYINRAFILGQQDLNSTPGNAAVNRHIGVNQVMCASSHSHPTNLLSFFAIGRNSAVPAFTEAERLLLELLMPHLTAMLNLSHVSHMSQLRSTGSALRSSMGVVDSAGILHTAESGFDRFLRDEWPCWIGPNLPEPLAGAIARRSHHYQGGAVNAELAWVKDRVLVTLTHRSVLDALSPQERAVTVAYAAGLSYKEVARSLHVAPTTVRHHLRSVYVKLGVSDKAALAQAVAAV